MNGQFLETLGQYLRREREFRNVSLEELSKGTRISLPFLEALESDDFQFFSQAEFILGFLKGYARHLGLDQEEILRRYRIQSELASRRETLQQLPLFPTSTIPVEATPELKRVLPVPRPRKGERRSRRRIFIQVVILFLAVLLSFYIHYFLKQTEDLKNSPKIKDSFPQAEEKKDATEK